jgi:hypothetical protein
MLMESPCCRCVISDVEIYDRFSQRLVRILSQYKQPQRRSLEAFALIKKGTAM